MTKLKSILGYSGAILTVALALVTPFVLLGWFTQGIGAMGLRIHPSYSGGEVSHTIQRQGYRILVYRRVGRTTPWQRVDPFVQARWTPGTALPATLSDDLDLNGDGKPDVHIVLDTVRMVVDAAPLGAGWRPLHSRGVTSFSALIARVDGDIVVRLPVE